MKASFRTEKLAGVFRRGLARACLLAALCAPAQARAQGNTADSERASVLFKRGKAAFNSGKYSDALRIYGEAWRLKQSPDIAANLAQAEAELGKHRDAAEHFAFALAHLLPSSTDEQKKSLADGLEVEKSVVGTLHVTLEPPDSALSIDDAQVTLPTNGDVFVEPGDHRAVVTHDGYEPNQQTIHVSKGAAQVLWIKLLEVGTPAPSTPSPLPAPVLDVAAPKLEAPSRSIVPVAIGGGLVAAGAAVGLVFMFSANSSQNDADQLGSTLGGNTACGVGTTHATECGRLHESNQDIDRSRTIEVAGFAIAGAAAIGTLLYLLWPHPSDDSAGRILTPTLTAGAGMSSLGLAGRF